MRVALFVLLLVMAYVPSFAADTGFLGSSMRHPDYQNAKPANTKTPCNGQQNTVNATDGTQYCVSK